MKGKNLGRIILVRGYKRQQCKDGVRPDCLRTELKALTEGEHPEGRPLLPKVVRHSHDIILPVNPFSGAELAYFPISVPLTSSVRYLFYEFHHDVSKELYPRAFCRQPEESRTIWFERVIEDPCVFHCTMAVTSARISHSQGYGGKSVASTQHFVMALHLLRRDLDTNSKLQNSSIVVAISLAMYSNINGSTGESRIHLQGLKRMLDLCPGGLTSVYSGTPEVGNKIRRADIELALLEGTPTLFSSQSISLPDPLHVVPLHDRRPYVTLPYPLDEISTVVRLAMTDVLALCDYAGRAQLSAFQYLDMVISIIQRLIDYAPLGSARPSRLLDDACQLGLLAFMSTVLNHTRGRRSACSPLLSDLLRKCLDRFDDEMACGRGHKYSSFYLWLTFIFVLSAPEFEQYYHPDSSFARRIRVLANTLALETLDDIIAHLSVYPWVAAFHDDQSKKLWDVICR
ncbi:uncharacterized protein LY89DRAFT_595551 [Mollisia scopiformis]|uniref:Uncharacterized protein n=1 Tax=Mollisia scopiformis TaxID=149040 RepID=A0A194WSF5_MOLSC|nr:uncharacterized protein LY89DRAFT_595551 [Mollisia scopiformis]KUJ10895.1 hypothetical protein LY89DRAFT_595551 [Mollisia scopiformis]